MMENEEARKCGCKGIRSCLSCEKTKGIRSKFSDLDELKERSHVYCLGCACAYPGWDWQERDECPAHRTASPKSRPPDGIHVQTEFISEEEERILVERINRIPWMESQSGRRKQDFGPKVNFKKKKVRSEAFSGFPDFVGFLLRRFMDVPGLRDFRPVELCHLLYDPLRGATIDPHVDDTWLWGERLVTVNLGAPTALTLSDGGATVAIRVPLPRRSLVVLEGEARYEWTHAIYREDVKGERIAITFRELAPEFRTGGAREITGRELLNRAGQVARIEETK